MLPMDMIRLVLAALFVAMSIGIALQARQVRRLGLVLGALSYGAAGLTSFATRAWWPLLAGFGAAWVLRRMGADPPTDLRFDLPFLERELAADPPYVIEYADKWLSADAQVALVQSTFVQEAWSRGLRKPAHVPDSPYWAAASASAAWKGMLASDLEALSSLTEVEALRYIDDVGNLCDSTLITAGQAMLQYDLPPVPPSLAFVESKIADRQRRAAYVTAYVVDAVLAARLRALAWTYQQWYGERYQLPGKRDAATL